MAWLKGIFYQVLFCLLISSKHIYHLGDFTVLKHYLNTIAFLNITTFFWVFLLADRISALK